MLAMSTVSTHFSAKPAPVVPKLSAHPDEEHSPMPFLYCFPRASFLDFAKEAKVLVFLPKCGCVIIQTVSAEKRKVNSWFLCDGGSMPHEYAEQTRFQVCSLMSRSSKLSPHITIETLNFTEPSYTIQSLKVLLQPSTPFGQVALIQLLREIVLHQRFLQVSHWCCQTFVGLLSCSRWTVASLRHYPFVFMLT